MNDQQQQQPTSDRERRIRELVEHINHLDRIHKQLLQLWRKLIDDGYDLEHVWRSLWTYSPQSQRWLFDSEPLWRTRINAGAMPQSTPSNSPIAGAVYGININESPLNYYPPYRNPNLLANLSDGGNNQIFHYSPSHDCLQYSRSADSQSLEQMNSLTYNNAIGSYGLQRRSEISSPLVNNANYEVNAPYHDHDDRRRRRHRFRVHQSVSPFTSVNEVCRNVLAEAKSQHGSRFLQDKLRLGSAEDIDMIFSEVKRGLRPLMVHQFGHHVVQKLIDVADDGKLDEILRLLTSDLREFGQVCADFYGAKVVQKLVGRLETPEQQSLLASPMSRIILWLTKGNTSSHDVIYECLSSFSSNHKKLLLRAIEENCLNIARDKNGTRALQKYFDHADDESFNHLADPIVQNADTLSEDFYANYVVQHVIEKRNLDVNRNIAAKLKGKFVSISTNKHGSNVVEKLVRDSGLEEVADMVITEILDSPSPLEVSQDLMGNFVVQAAIKVIKEGPLFNRLRKHLKDNARYLQTHLCGKKVLEAMDTRLKEINETLNIRNIRNM